MSYLTVPLASSHTRSRFQCGQPALDHYIQKQVSQDVKRKLAVCFVTADPGGAVTGFYTLSNASVPMTDAPEAVRKKMPQAYQAIPVTLLGRLAVDRTSQGQKLGEKLLVDALKRSVDLSAAIASYAVIVDPINEQAAAFYGRYGFILLENGKMFLSMKTIEALMR